MKKLALFSTLVFAAASANAESFDVIGKASTDNRARVDFNYSATSLLTGVVNITVRNTSILNGQGGLNPAPHITGLMFNLPSTIYSLLSYTVPTGWDVYPNSPLSGLLPVPEDSVRPPSNVGSFDMCSETHNANQNCNGGGPDGPRLSAGETGMFSFTFSGLNMNSLTTTSFLSLLSTPNNRNSTTTFFALRFQTTSNSGGSDVGLGATLNPVPEPATLFTLGSAICLLVYIQRRVKV